MMLDVWKRQFSKNKLLMVHEEPHVFLKSQWQSTSGPSIFYLLYRWLLTCFIFGTWLLSVIDPKNFDESVHFRAKWPIYLTNWGYTMCFLQSILGAFCVTAWYIKSRKSKDPDNDYSAWTTGPYKIYWVLNVIATDIAFGITILYWALIHDGTKMAVDAQNIFVHGSNSAVMVLELLIVAHPIYLVQCYWSILFGLIYIIFSVIYHAAGGTSRNGDPYIYPVLDWGKAGQTTILCVLVLVFIIVLHIISWAIQLFRRKLDKKLRKRKYSADVTKPPAQRGFDNVAISSDVV